jgi:hypothetical protein
VADEPWLPEDATGLLDGSADLFAELNRWAATARVEDAATARARERWLRQQAAEEASLAGILLDLAEQATPVVVTTTADRRHRGTIRAVGVDFIVVHARAGRDVLVGLAAVGGVRPEARGDAPVGDRDAELDLRLVEAIAALAAERPRVFVVTIGAREGVSGELRGVGRDVVTLRLDGDPRATVYVPVASIAELSLV